MRAVVVDSQNVKYVKDMKVPTPEFDELQIRVVACALDELDIKVQKGEFSSLVSYPLTPGYQISGTVQQMGSAVRGFSKGDQVVAILPLDNGRGGLAEFVNVKHINAIKKPNNVSFSDAAACLLDGLRVYHTLHYLAHVKPGHFITIISHSPALNRICVELVRGMKDVRVIVVATTPPELNGLEGQGSHVVRVVDPRCESVVSCIMEETGGLGVDAVLDFQDLRGTSDKPHTQPTNLENHNNHDFKSNDDMDSVNPKPAGKHDNTLADGLSDRKDVDAIGEVDGLGTHAAEGGESSSLEDFFVPKALIIRCLAVHGKWCTTSQTLQLQAHESMQLAMRSASVCFLFEQAWLLSPRHHGKYLHILEDLMASLKKGVFRPVIAKTVKLDEVRGSLRLLKSTSKSG
eukprot:CAMPEP_0197534898 /NCGR_PEP_ID=MMETSP1318-20131121/48718_1 /TAXON_ID=552666 /ORGANISM="Partenskyella glossopodia, Strain RCC365" /LENGTH=402 /DNA_ID=CAMNT_0043092327 /DNA_START=116 /DNA_END=1321 /DNA_ORIENTATION=-